ncbi:glutaredoxin family protein [Microbacterium sp. cx-55]|uniref:glutaredoxin family protein n=1 Tax=unclassified Microbacterium TaxID=2609290 RepID=UPI001CBC58C8|nr:MULTISPECIES: glutaredoxin family protein [unclassified Microbacterium]MBZ4487835.1 glutaredoxin family protein [Microbacterium sp. cx-55]MCC4909139.1 glutaredoxin family protein [Microbacterium sp. cx-59]UGB34754.1 glutaredoxin family protein [Microbacterium sp. cx-55]
MTTITLIGKDGCHLCDVARGVLEHVLADIPEDAADRVEVIEQSILEEPALFERWSDKIPVLLIDGTLHAHWRVAPERLRDAVLTATRSRTEGAIR